MAREIRFGDAENELQEEHFRRYVELMKLTVSLSFGGFMFLLAFEKDYLTPKHHAAWLVHTAWFLMLASALLGMALQMTWVVDPIRRLANAQLLRSPSNPTQRRIHISGAVPWFENWLYWGHIGSLILAILSIAAYKAANI